jgi:hypothetical protein
MLVSNYISMLVAFIGACFTVLAPFANQPILLVVGLQLIGLGYLINIFGAIKK